MSESNPWPQSKNANLLGATQSGGIPSIPCSDSDIQAISNMLDDSGDPPRPASKAPEALEDKCSKMLAKMPDLYQPKPIIDGVKEETPSPTSMGGMPIVNRETEMKKYLNAGYEIIRRI